MAYLAEAVKSCSFPPEKSFSALNILFCIGRLASTRHLRLCADTYGKSIKWPPNGIVLLPDSATHRHRRAHLLIQSARRICSSCRSRATLFKDSAKLSERASRLKFPMQGCDISPPPSPPPAPLRIFNISAKRALVHQFLFYSTRYAHHTRAHINIDVTRG
jgi:hypothetical protein